MNQHVVTNIQRRPNLMDLYDYALSQLDSLVSTGPSVNTFCKLNSISKMTVEPVDGFRLGIKFDATVSELKPMEGKPLQWLESLLGAKLKFDCIKPYDCGGGYLYYTLQRPDDDDDIDRIYPTYRTQQYWWGGGNWMAWDD